MKNVFFPESKIEFIKACTDERCRILFDKAMEQAEKSLELIPLDEASVQVDGEGYAVQHENYGNAAGPFSGAMQNLSFAYCVTEDKKYFEKARELMLKYCTYSRWHGKGALGKGELITGHFLTGMSYGWGTFSELFSEDDKKYLADRIYTLGIRAQLDDWVLPGTKIHCFDTMGHNWWPVCVSSGALAAIVMSDYLPDGKALADKCCKGLEAWFGYKGNPINMKPATLDNGAFYEGIVYYNYSLFEYLRFAEAYIAVTGNTPFDDEEIIKKSAEFLVNCFYPSTKDDYVIGFNDCDETLYFSAVPYMLSRYPDIGILRYYTNHSMHSQDTVIINRLIRFRELYLLSEEKPVSLSVCYDKIGWAIFRDSFDENANLLAVKCGDSWNHAHCDAAHFIFFTNGSPEIFDSHRCPYGNDIYRDYYVQSKAHNVILFNGNGQCPDDHHHHVRPKGELYNFTHNGNYRYVCADASGPMGRYFRKHLRHFLWADDIIIIYDDIWAYEKGEANFLLHSDDNTCFRMLTPCEKRTENGYLGNEIKEVTFTSYNRQTDDYGRVKFISAICLNEGISPVFEEITNGYKITYGSKNIYINAISDHSVMHRNCFNTFDGILTDAVALVEDNNKYFVVNGSIIRKENEIILDEFARITGKI